VALEHTTCAVDPEDTLVVVPAAARSLGDRCRAIEGLEVVVEPVDRGTAVRLAHALVLVARKHPDVPLLVSHCCDALDRVPRLRDTFELAITTVLRDPSHVVMLTPPGQPPGEWLLVASQRALLDLLRACEPGLLGAFEYAAALDGERRDRAIELAYETTRAIDLVHDILPQAPRFSLFGLDPATGHRLRMHREPLREEKKK
jgi:hypothetical protein